MPTESAFQASPGQEQRARSVVKQIVPEGLADLAWRTDRDRFLDSALRAPLEMTKVPTLGMTTRDYRSSFSVRAMISFWSWAVMSLK